MVNLDFSFGKFSQSGSHTRSDLNHIRSVSYQVNKNSKERRERLFIQGGDFPKHCIFERREQREETSITVSGMTLLELVDVVRIVRAIDEPESIALHLTKAYLNYQREQSLDPHIFDIALQDLNRDLKQEKKSYVKTIL